MSHIARRPLFRVTSYVARMANTIILLGTGSAVLKDASRLQWRVPSLVLVTRVLTRDVPRLLRVEDISLKEALTILEDSRSLDMCLETGAVDPTIHISLVLLVA